MDFTDFELDPSILAGIKALKYTTPTPIQEKAIPVVLQGNDLIGLAQTGTGKTAAFVLPVLQKLLKSPRGRVGALIISPTRELAEQTTENINYFTYDTGLRGVSIYGGVSMYNQVEALKRGAELVVACPGRLMDHMLNGSIDLSQVEVLIIDEADRMFDMGFLPDIRNIVRCLTAPHQTLLFSATMPPDIRKLVQEVLHDPVTVQIGQTAPVDSVTHALYPVSQHLKIGLLKEILKQTDTDSVVIFTRTKHRVERVADALRRAGYSVASLQGDMEQNQRQAAIDGFRYGDLKILVATDIAARGLDILSITHVINFDMPDTTDAYIHRIGRTGRVKNKGDAFTLVTDEDKAMVRALEKVFKKPIETRQIEGFDYSAAEPARFGSRSGGPVGNVNESRHRRGNRPERRAPGNSPARSQTPAKETVTPPVSNEQPAANRPARRVRNRRPEQNNAAAQPAPRQPANREAPAENKPAHRGISNRKPPAEKPAGARNGVRRYNRPVRKVDVNAVSRVRYASPESISHAQ